MLYSRSPQQVSPQHPANVYAHPAYVQQEKQRQRDEALQLAQQEERKLKSIVVFFGLWMAAGALLLISYMFEYLV